MDYDADGDAEQDQEVSNETVGPANGSVRCFFRVFKRKYGSQQMTADERFGVWLVRAHSIDEFRTSLWELVRPHVKRAIEVVQPGDGGRIGYAFRWGGPADPSEEDAPQFVTFCEKKNKKVYTWNHITSTHTLKRWQDHEIILVIHEYSTALKTKAVYQIALNTFLAAGLKAVAKASSKPVAKKPAAVKRPVLPPAADGYSFRDEVRAMRETFSQMRSLMNILDSRLSLLEQKCDEATIVPVKMDTTEEAVEDPLVNFSLKVEMLDCDEDEQDD
ncbi:conserved hypothetical protein [Culex quinquefasciatus]|uniref:Uncharacterized protein n=1 Tax=Culex quinquefasciatus TaxID=7176 RepID=B0X9N4_CULQU|nr:uncharacterized protein LOC6049630 [Culex quinquefasciatus]EDS43236.1 conserved hypothetical protein [Culex quinquefasciatus]|eukprot:XP_001866356.1 conserved hypothetical protein [Culex quinquefasciatus]